MILEELNDPKLGGLWGSIRSGADIIAMLQQNRIRTAEYDNVLCVEITRDDGSVGIYELPHKSAIDLFP